MPERRDLRQAYEGLLAAVPSPRRRPLIGITGNYGARGCELAEPYYRAVIEAGGAPLVLPPHDDEASIIAALEGLDGLLLSGGGDINPLLSGEEPAPGLRTVCPERDKGELLTVRLAHDMQMPMLGICRGVQTLAVALGGKVHQDIASCLSPSQPVKHEQDAPRPCATHTVDISEGSLLRAIVGQGRLAVNSLHHQSVADAGEALRVSARARDGVVEAIESAEHKSIVGVQWHPEWLAVGGDEASCALFAWLVGEARSYRRAVSLHKRIITLDSHCDTPMKFGTAERRLTTLPLMHCGRLDATVMVAYLPQGKRDAMSLGNASKEAERILALIEAEVQRHSDVCGLARTAQDVARLKGEGKRAVMMGVENAYAIGRELSRIESLRRRGVVYMTLCHNGDNDVCDSAKGQGEHGGLSAFGREVVREMNRTGLMIDLSHAASTSFRDALELSTSPVVCSHSSCRALCDHPRNLSDEQMKALASKGGVMQVTLYDGFLRQGGGASIDDAVEHIKHAVEVMGIEHVGIGTDFDGDGGVPGLANASELLNLTRRLQDEGFGDEELRLLWGGNFLRALSLCQSQAMA